MQHQIANSDYSHVKVAGNFNSFFFCVCRWVVVVIEMNVINWNKLCTYFLSIRRFSLALIVYVSLLLCVSQSAIIKFINEIAYQHQFQIKAKSLSKSIKFLILHSFSLFIHFQSSIFVHTKKMSTQICSYLLSNDTCNTCKKNSVYRVNKYRKIAFHLNEMNWNGFWHVQEIRCDWFSPLSHNDMCVCVERQAGFKKNDVNWQFRRIVVLSSLLLSSISPLVSLPQTRILI